MIIEKCYGYDLSEVERIVMNFEKYEGKELLDALQKALKAE